MKNYYNRYRAIRASRGNASDEQKILQAIRNAGENTDKCRYTMQFARYERYEDTKYIRKRKILPGDFLAIMAAIHQPSSYSTEGIIEEMIDYYGDFKDMVDDGVRFTVKWALSEYDNIDFSSGGTFCIYLKNEDTGKVIINDRDMFEDNDDEDEW